MSTVNAGWRGPNIVRDGLILYLDAGSGTSYSPFNSGTTWRDISGNTNNGTLTNGPTYSSDNGGSIVFDGTNDYVAFSSLTTTLLGLTSSNGGTMACWLKISLLNRWTGVINFWSSPNQVAFGWDIDTNNILRAWKNSSSVNTVSIGSYSNIWTYYILVSNSSNIILYVNGNQTSTISVGGNIGDNGTLMFGDHWDNPIQGNASSIQIYNKALSATEVLQNYNASKARFGL